MTSANRQGVSRYGVIDVRFGPGAPEAISEERSALYARIVESVTGRPPAPVTTGVDRTLPISSVELNSRGNDSLSSKFEARYRGWGERPDVVVVDAIFGRQRTVPGRLQLQIAAAMIEFAKTWCNRLFILLVDSVPPSGEAVRRIFQPLVDNKRLIVVDREGHSLGKSLDSEGVTRFFNAFDALSVQEAGHRLRLKMIRRLGHFQRPLGTTSECVRYFYDGEKCIAEIATLIINYVHRNHSGTEVLFFDCSVSQWLEEAVKYACITLNAEPVDVREAIRDPSAHREVLTRRSILVLPLVDTGGTVESLRDGWLVAVPNIDFPKTLSILSTGDEVSREPNVRIIVTGGESIKVDYFMKVDRGLHRTKPCKMCNVGIPPSSHNDERIGTISSFDFWEMADDSGWISEENVPAERQSLGFVPNFSRIFVENGAWLAERALQRIGYELDIEYSTQPFVLVAPDESGARAFAESIRLLHDTCSIAYVPKTAVDIFRNLSVVADDAVRQWEVERPNWYVQLRETSAKMKFVFVEEFTATGGTARAVARLIRAVRRNIAAHALICDFHPSKPPVDGQAPRLALYEFDI